MCFAMYFPPPISTQTFCHSGNFVNKNTLLASILKNMRESKVRTRYGEQTPNVDVTPSPHELKVSRPQVMSMSMIVIRIIVTVMM